MFDKEAITALQEGQSITAAYDAVTDGVAYTLPVALPSDFKLHDLEKFMPQRRRARGTMATRFIEPFATYATTHATNGATVFVNPDNMTATAVLDLGTPENPGHAEHLVKLQPSKSAAYSALTSITAGPRSQQDVAEFLEDWAPQVACFNADGEIKPHLAIAAVRKITIDGMRKVESEEQSLGSSQSAFESVQASSKDPLPTTIHFTCQPYADLSERTFVLRLGVLTGDAKPKLTLRIQKAEEHTEEMAKELVVHLEKAMRAVLIPVVVGDCRKAD